MGKRERKGWDRTGQGREARGREEWKGKERNGKGREGKGRTAQEREGKKSKGKNMRGKEGKKRTRREGNGKERKSKGSNSTGSYPKKESYPKKKKHNSSKSQQPWIQHLSFGSDVCHVLPQGKRLPKGRLGGDVGGEADAFAHVGQTRQQQEVLGEHRGEVLQRDACRKQQRGRKAESLLYPPHKRP
jgi:hypothetical protein